MLRAVATFVLLCFGLALAEPPALLPVPDVRQSTTWTCGASALQAVLAYYGLEFREGQVAELCGSGPDHGTFPQEIVRVARAQGLEAELREGMSLADLETAEGPVIVAIQAWREEASQPWSQEWESGHYVVVIGQDADNVYFEDPSLLGSRGYIPRGEFLERWHDVDGSGRRYLQMGIAVGGRKPSPPPDLAPIE